MDLNTLRKQSNNLKKIVNAFEDQGTKSYKDDRVWKLDPDKAGNAVATIRFLNACVDGDELPWIKMFTHGFQGPTGVWYIENSRTTIGQPDPISELNVQLWNSTDDAKSPIRDQVRRQKRKLNYYSNILVVDDPKHPENNGQVKLYRYGKKIYDQIMEKAQPTFDDIEPVNVFDFWAGANFKLRQKRVDKFPNYDSSSFEEPSAIADSDEAILEIVGRAHSLTELVNPKNFKSYDELKNRLNRALNTTTVESTEPVVAAPVVKAKAAVETKAIEQEDPDDMLAYFRDAAKED